MPQQKAHELETKIRQNSLKMHKGVQLVFETHIGLELRWVTATAWGLDFDTSDFVSRYASKLKRAE